MYLFKRSILGGKCHLRMDSELRRLYTDPSLESSYGGVDKLWKSTGKKYARSKVKDFLHGQDTYTLHRGLRKSFKRNRIISWGVDYLWQADLVDVTMLYKFNKPYKYLLTVIDVLSKYAWVVPLKDKKGVSLVNAFGKIFKGGRVPSKLNTDAGGEFVNRKLQALLKKRKVIFYTTRSEKKAAVAERFNLTLKSKMWRYFTQKNTKRYMPVLAKMVQAYNNTWHSSIKMKPSDVTEENASQVWYTLYGKDYQERKPLKYKYRVGDSVRISKLKATYEKSYLPNWTEEIFTVKECVPSRPPVYRLQDSEGLLIEGTFYAEELLKVTVNEEKRYIVEKVLDQKKRRGETLVLVKWRGYPKSASSWIPKSSLETI